MWKGWMLEGWKVEVLKRKRSTAVKRRIGLRDGVLNIRGGRMWIAAGFVVARAHWAWVVSRIHDPRYHGL